jgi:hypothetical protein
METAIQNILTQLCAILVAIGSTASMVFTLPPSAVPSADTAVDLHGANNATSVSTVVAAPPSRPLINAFFVAANGNDTNDCKTEATPCQTIAKINAGTYVPGTTIKFRGGDSFPGVLTITPRQVPSKGDKTNPIVIESYGTGRATILANAPGVNNGNLGPKSYAVKIDGVSGVTLQNLIVSANGTTTQFGVLVQNSFGGVADTITVRGNDISGFNITASQDFSSEIFITGYAYRPKASPVCGALANVKVLNNTVHGANGVSSPDDNGITGQDCRNIRNATYSGNTVFNIGGRPHQGGNGIIFIGVTNGLAEHNLVHDLAANVAACGGPAGIWAYHSSDITIQLNEVHHMHAVPWHDGACDFAAFDADSDTRNVIFQYNYSHDNDGPAYLAYGGENLPHGPTIIRYNISVNDNRITANGSGSLSLPTNGVVQIYNNTIYKNFAAQGTSPGTCWSGSWGFNGGLAPGSVYANNICYSHTHDIYGRTAHNMVLSQTWTNLFARMSHNLWFGANSWTTPQGDVFTLADWQRVTNGDAGAIFVDPMLTNIAGGAAGFALKPGSPAIGTGVDLTATPYNLDIGKRDYFGNVPSRNIGADAAQY